jgi:hypothetical protein
VLFEAMLVAYQEKTGWIDAQSIPSDAELIQRLLEERDKRDAE